MCQNFELHMHHLLHTCVLYFPRNISWPLTHLTQQPPSRLLAVHYASSLSILKVNMAAITYGLANYRDGYQSQLRYQISTFPPFLTKQLPLLNLIFASERNFPFTRRWRTIWWPSLPQTCWHATSSVNFLRTTGELLEKKKVPKAASIKQRPMPHSRIMGFTMGTRCVGWKCSIRYTKLPSAFFVLY